MEISKTEGKTVLKTCSKCLVEKSLDEFYRKGSRIDSWCKFCKKKKRRANYIVGKNELNKGELERLKLFLKTVTAYEVKQFRAINEKLRAIIESISETMQPENI
ncbi:MAG: hypothetical protein KAQ98_07580 [Bacteriovoracaceae bacterium]|nr:hypothetical protein [Bacteriovoracaceae bacterium]